jgi:hypothetical protein
LSTYFFQEGATTEDTLVMLIERLNWIMQKLDHGNIKRLYTEYCSIRSEEGETQIVGPLLNMYDKQTVPVLRLQQGYDPISGDFVFNLFDKDGNNTVYLSSEGQFQLTGKPLMQMYDNQASPELRLQMGYDPISEDFVFNMFNKSGQQTIFIDSNGDANFTGVITGGTVRTAESGARIELKNNTLITYDLLNRKVGLAWGNGIGSFGDVSLFDTGIEVMQFFASGTGGGFDIKPLNGAKNGWIDPQLKGNVQHITGAKIGFFGATPVSKDSVSDLSGATAGTSYTSNEQTMLQNVYNKVNELLNALQSYGLV